MACRNARLSAATRITVNAKRLHGLLAETLELGDDEWTLTFQSRVRDARSG